MVKLKMALAAACALVSFATSSTAADLRVNYGVDSACPTDYRPLTFQEISTVNGNSWSQDDLTAVGKQVCGELGLGRWDILRLGDGQSFGGPGYNCAHFPEGDYRALGGTLCFKDTFEYNVDRVGGDVGSVGPFKDAVGCEMACKANEQCDSFTFLSTSGQCFLKHGEPAGRANPNHISGVVTH